MLRFQLQTFLMVVILSLTGCGKVRYVNNDAAGASSADQIGQAGEAGKNNDNGDPATDGDTTGTDTAGNDDDSTGGDATAGDNTIGGDATAGETSGDTTNGGDATAGDNTGGDATAGGDTAGTATGGGDSGGSSAVLQSIELRPSTIKLPTGTQHYFKVFGKYDDNTEADITSDNSIVYEASNSALLSIIGFDQLSMTIGVKAEAPGNVTLTAKKSEFMATAAIEIVDVNFVSFRLEPNPLTVNVGESNGLRAVGVSDGGEEFDLTVNASYTSLDQTIATVGDTVANKAVVKGVKLGVTEVTAVFRALTAAAKVIVLEDGILFGSDSYLVEAVPAQLDIIFTIDNSISMHKAIANVQANIDNFANTLASKSDVKVHILSAKTIPVLTDSSGNIKYNQNGNVQPLFYRPIVAPVSEYITQYDVLVDSMDVALAAAIATCPESSNAFVVGGQSKICDEPVTNINGVDQAFVYGPGPEFADLNNKTLFELGNGRIAENLRPKSKRIYVMVTNSDIITEADLSTGSKTLDHTKFTAAVSRYSYDYPTVYSFAKIPGMLDCPFSQDAIDLISLTDSTMGKSYDLCEVDWSSQFDELAAETLSLKDNIFTAGKENVIEVISVTQGGRVIDPGSYKVNGNVITVHPSAVEISPDSSADLYIEYFYRQ